MPPSSLPADRERAEHMLQAARDAVVIATNRNRAELDSDILLRHAMIHCVQLIGEAAARIGPAGRAHVSALPWEKVVGIRHILVHDYFKIDHDAVWRVVTGDIPKLVFQLEAALAAWPPETAE